MVWIILTFVFGWLLCGAWALRMDGKTYAAKEGFPLPIVAAYFFGPIVLPVFWLEIWPGKLWKFAKGIATAWQKAKGE